MGANIPPIVVNVAGGCKKCGNPDVDMPEVFDDETNIHCDRCGHTAKRSEFFSESDV